MENVNIILFPIRKFNANIFITVALVVGVLFLILLLDKQKKYARRRAKAIWWTNE